MESSHTVLNSLCHEHGGLNVAALYYGSLQVFFWFLSCLHDKRPRSQGPKGPRPKALVPGLVPRVPRGPQNTHKYKNCRERGRRGSVWHDVCTESIPWALESLWDTSGAPEKSYKSEYWGFGVNRGFPIPPLLLTRYLSNPKLDISTSISCWDRCCRSAHQGRWAQGEPIRREKVHGLILKTMKLGRIRCPWVQSGSQYAR